MKNLFFQRLCAAALLALGLHQGLHAQADLASTTYAVRVAHLTSAERDAVVRDLATSGDAKLVFACVPAGVLVFEATQGRDRATANNQALTVTTAHTSSQRITQAAMSLAQAEAECATARNR